MPSYVTHLISTGNPRGRYYYPAHLTNEKTEDLSSPGSWWGIKRLAAGIITNIIIIKGRFAFESFLFGRPICHYGPTQGSSQAQKMDTISLKKKKSDLEKKIYCPQKTTNHILKPSEDNIGIKHSLELSLYCSV